MLPKIPEPIAVPDPAKKSIMAESFPEDAFTKDAPTVVNPANSKVVFRVPKITGCFFILRMLSVCIDLLSITKVLLSEK